MDANGNHRGDTNIAAVAALMADETRASILLALSDGRALTAGELARMARVAPSTACSHLAKLVGGGLLEVESWGRHRYFRVAGPEIIGAIEALAVLAPPNPFVPGASHERLAESASHAPATTTWPGSWE